MPKRPRRKTAARARTNPSRSTPRARRPAPALPDPGTLAAQLCVAGASVSADEFLWNVAEGLADALEARGIVIAEIAEDGVELRGIATVIRGRREEPFALELAPSPFAPIARGEEEWVECTGREAESLAAETMFPGSAHRIVAIGLQAPGALLPGVLAVLDPPDSHPAAALPSALAPVLERLAAELARRRAAARLAAHTTSADSPNNRIQDLERRVIALQARNQELTAAREALQAAERAKTEFLAGIGTSMRTPLNSVLGTLQLLVDSALDADQLELAENALAACESLVSGVNEVLDFASSDGGALLLEPARFDLRATVESVIEAYSAGAARRGVELVLQVSPELPSPLVGDPVRVRQLVNGLVENALAFTVRGHVLVTVDAPRKDARVALVRVAVEDTGAGIEPARLATLFEHASGAPRRTGSTGAPLPMIRRLAEAMDGAVLATSAPGEGSTFTATMTLAVDEAVPVTDQPAPLEGVRALIVDDVEIHRMVLRRQMTALGMRVETAPDGRTGLAMLRDAAESADPYRLALIDNVMPGMTGEELGRELRSDARTAGLALMMFTASADRDEARRFARAGFDGFFLKPILPSILQEAFVKVLAVRRGTGAEPAIVTRREVEKPTRPAPAPAPQAPAPLEPLATAAGEGAKPRVLVAEDDPTNQLVAVRLLERLGFEVDRADDGLQAVELWRKNDYAVVFMDCLMPQMTGYEATTRIRSEETDGRHTPIIALTASVLPSDRERCRQSGMDAFLAKPVREASLRMVVQRTLDQLEAAASPLA